MPRITAASAVQATLAELTKEGNKVAKSGELPPGRHADKGYDVQSFNSGMRYAMQKVNTALKQVEKGTFKMPEAKPAPAKRATSAPASGKTKQAALDKATVKKSPRGQTAADKGKPVTPTQKARASKAPAKKTTRAKKVATPPATITPIEEARKAVAADLASGKKTVIRR